MRTLLIWLVLACLLPGVIGAVVLFVHQYRESRAQQEKDMVRTARALVQAVDGHLLRSQAVALALSPADSLKRRDFPRFYERAREVVALAGPGTNIVLRDEGGRQILNTAVEFGRAPPAPPAPEQVRRVFATGRPTISDLFIGPVLKRPIMSVDVPVVIDGQVAYALGVGIVAEQFTAILKAQGLPQGWVAAVLDSSGTIVGRTHSEHQFVGQKTMAGLLGALTAAPEGAIEAISKEGVPVMTFYSRSPLTDWNVVIGIPVQVVEDALAQTLSRLGFGVAALFAIGLLLAWAMARQIAGSVKAVADYVVTLGEGVPAPPPPVRIKETAEVAAATARTAGLLKERAASLQARDIELAEAHRLAKFGTWHWNLATGEITASDSVREIFGRDVPSFAEMRGTLLSVESWELVRVASEEAVRSGKGYDLELEVNHGGGHVIWVDSKSEVIRNECGEVAALRGTIQDITERRETEEELRQFKFFSDHSNDGHLVLDQSGRLRYANRMECERLGFSEAELLAMNVWDVDPLFPAERYRKLFARCQTARVPPFEGVHRRRDGTTFPVEVTATVLELRGEWLMFATSRDITERKLAEQRVREAALHDSLTGLPNRALVFEYGGHLLAAARRNHGKGALLFVDLDRFKPINDLYGHETGDRVLQEVGQRLVACTRQEDLVGRLGGDEFVIILPHLDPEATGGHRAAIVAQHIVDSISRPFHLGALELSLSPSVGISHYPEHGCEVGTLIHAADLAMYSVKQAGRAGYQFYTPELDRRAGLVLTLEARLKKALRNGGLELHYQPVVDIRSGRSIGAEALVRLSDGDGDKVGPDRFIPVAEAAGLIGELGEWVATEACRQHEAWLREGLKVVIAINVSPLQFRQRAFAERLGRIVAAKGIDPEHLQIEVTESTVMENVDEAVEILHRIKSFGIKVALDDFGTGYSSLSSLSSLPLDKLKVDQSFVRRIECDPTSQAIAKAVIALGRALNLEIVGEGIESEETLSYLRREGCDQAQGYWFSAPLAAAEFARWYRGQQFH